MNYTFFWLKNALFRRHALNEYKVALKNEFISNAELNEINFEKRKQLVQFAYQNSPFYKEFYDINNFHPVELKSPQDWEAVPILEKDHIRKNKTIQVCFDKKYLIKTTTGGSTGSPVKTYRDKRFPEEIIKWRMLRRWEVEPGADMAQFWRVPEVCKKFSYKIKNRIIWWPTKRLSIDASFLTNAKFDAFTRKINKVKPAIFWGYVGAIEQYAVFLKNNGIDIATPKCVWVTAAPVSKIQKNLFAQVISEKILDQYACSEIHWVGANVPGTDNLILEYDYRHIDIVNSDNKACEVNEMGDILLTDLENYVFPLIKYRVGDRSMFVEEKSKYAPSFPMIAPVKGRISDFIRTKNNIVLNGEFLTTIFDHQTDVVQQFQIHQTDPENVTINIVLNESCTKNQIDDQIFSNLKKITNNELAFHVQIKKSITPDKGKIRFIKNDTL